MKTYKYFNFIAIFTLLFGMSFSLQSCKDDEDETLWGNIGDVVNIKYGDTITLFQLPTVDDDVLVLPSDIALLGAVSDNDCAYFSDGKIIGSNIGTATIKFYRGNRDNVIKTITVNVLPNYEITLKSGESKLIADIIGEAPEGSIREGNYLIVKVSDGYIHAFHPGSSYIIVNSKAIAVTVTGYKGEALFSAPYMADLASPENIKASMKAYNLSSESIQKVNGTNYLILTYAPFDNCKSISYYVIKSGWERLDYARIDTGKSSNEVLGWLLRDYSAYYIHHAIDDIHYFEQPNTSSYRNWRIYPVDDKWSTLELKYP